MAIIGLPIETKSREFHGKLWLGLNLLNLGHDVIIGDERGLRKNIEKIDPDFYLVLGAYGEKRTKNIEYLQKNGRSVGVLDTEGAVFDDITDFTNRIEPTTLEMVDVYFCWGRKQKEEIIKRIGEKTNIISSGNPRFDLLHPSIRGFYAESDLNTKKYTPYVLINTNFSKVNHYQRNKYNKQLYPGQLETMKNFCAACELLSEKLPNVTFIIRPHPSESEKIYYDLSKDYENIEVIFSGDVREWIYNASVVIHNGCTTGIEARMMDKMVIAYDPVDTYKPSQLPNSVSLTIKNENKLVDLIEKHIYGNIDYKTIDESQKILDSWFENYSQGLASKKMALTIDNIIDNGGRKPLSKNRQRILPDIESKFESFVYSPLGKYYFEKLSKMEVVSDNQYFETYPTLSGQRFQKFPGISIKEIGLNMKKMNDVADLTSTSISRVSGITDTYKLKPISKNDE